MSKDPLEAYRAFVARSPVSEDGYLFETPRCRFWPEPADQLQAPPGLKVVRGAEGAAFQLPGGASVVVAGFDAGTLERVLSLLPCRYARLALELGPAVQSLIEQTFSKVLFAPQAIAELELRQPACEIVRFPGSPYEVVRSYWRNLSSVREQLESLTAPPATVALFRELLRALHRRLLLGATGADGRTSFYLPASSLARKRATPGELYEGETRLERREGEVVITSGARVSVPLLGGTFYGQLLAESVADADALDAERQVEVEGLAWGRVVQGRAEAELHSRAWFLPPRPLTEGHFEALLSSLHAAWAARSRGDLAALLPALGAFHFCFVRSHPLPSANQSLSMSVINLLLRPVLGIGLPHLLLDQLALRFDMRAYQLLFARAARAWCAPWPSTTERLRNLLRMRDELNRFVSGFASVASLLEARARVESGTGTRAEQAEQAEQAEGARLSLLSDSGDASLGIG